MHQFFTLIGNGRERMASQIDTKQVHENGAGNWRAAKTRPGGRKTWNALINFKMAFAGGWFDMTFLHGSFITAAQ